VASFHHADVESGGGDFRWKTHHGGHRQHELSRSFPGLEHIRITITITITISAQKGKSQLRILHISPHENISLSEAKYLSFHIHSYLCDAVRSHDFIAQTPLDASSRQPV
jgi:hypothetical protein